MSKYKLDLGVSDEFIRSEYENGASVHALQIKYGTSYSTIRRRIQKSGGSFRLRDIKDAWTIAEDNVIIRLREDGFNLREISVGMFNRSLSSVSNRATLLRRDRKML